MSDRVKFPAIHENQRRQMLEPPKLPVRVVIDADVANEVDDFFALAWMLLASDDVFKIEGVYAAPDPGLAMTPWDEDRKRTGRDLRPIGGPSPSDTTSQPEDVGRHLFEIFFQDGVRDRYVSTS